MMAKPCASRYMVASFGIAFVLLTARAAEAFHFPWDQGHDTCTVTRPPDTPDTCDKCQTNPSPYVAATGAYTIAKQDVFIPGRLPVEVTRTYHSRDLHDGMLGQGWTFNYGLKLIEVTDGIATVVILRRADGHRDRFSQNADGTYASPPDVFDVLSRNGDGSWNLRRKDGHLIRFDAVGNLTSITDRNNNVITLAYDAVGALATITDDSGRTLTVAKGANGKIATITDPANRVVAYEYDINGRLIRVTDPRGSITTYAYDMQGNLTTVTDPEGNVVARATYNAAGLLATYMENGESYTLTHSPDQNRIVERDSQGDTRTIIYNDNGNITSITDPLGHTESTGYDTRFNPAQFTDKNGNVTTLAYDNQGNVVTKTDAIGNVTNYTYEPTFNQLTRIAESGRTTDFRYDARGNLIEETITAGSNVRRRTFTYDADGQLLTINNPRTDVSDVVTHTYDAHGNLATTTNALGHVTTMSYDIVGQLVQIRDRNGLISTIAYDEAGNELTRTVGGEVTSYTYDDNGAVKTVTIPSGLVTTYQYDALGRVTDSADGTGRTKYTLDTTGNILKEEVFDVQNTLQQTRSYTYDKLSRVTRETSGAGHITAFAYDNNGNRTSVTDPLGMVTTYMYDAVNRLTRVTDPEGRQTQYQYNALGYLSRVTDPLSNNTDYTVDGLGNIQTINSPDRGTEARTFDAAGNVLTKRDARGNTTRFEYDALNQLTRTVYADTTVETRSYAPGLDDYTGLLNAVTDPDGNITWTRDLHGRVTEQRQVLNAITLTTRQSYDGRGLLTQITYPSSKMLTLSYDSYGRVNLIQADGTTVVDQIRYLPFGSVAGWTWGNGTTYTRSFDLDGQLTGFPLGNVAHTVTYDAAAHITGITGSNAKSFGYDGLGRVDSFTAPGRSQTYTYDANGNRRTLVENTQTTTYSYLSGSNRLQSRTQQTSQSYTYDPTGNIIQDGPRSFTYDTNGRLTQVTANGSSTTYRYNALGQRGSKSAPGTSAPNLLFIYDEEGHLLGEYDATGAPVQETVYLADIPIALLAATDDIQYVYADQINAPRVVTDTDDTVIWRWESDPFGVGNADEDPDGDNTDLTFNLRFPGQYFDAETTLHYNYFRDYDPTLGRYIQADPIGLAGGLNLYLYANGNPVSLVDPTGEVAPLAAAAIRAAIAAAYRALAEALKKCARDPVCRCRAFYAAYGGTKGLCKAPGIAGCSGCEVPSAHCCAIKLAQAAALGACVSLRQAYVAAGCDRVIPTTADHPGQVAQASQALANCTAKIANICKCIDIF